MKNMLIPVLSLLAATGAVWSGPDERGPAPGGAFQALRCGEVQPRGWLRDQILMDATNGYGPVLDRLTDRADLASFDSRHKTELTKPKIGEVWWNGETTGNWLDGLIRTACYSGDAAARKQVDEIVARLLAMQEEDGYLGTYPKALRFEQPVTSKNGELWSQTCLFRGLLAYAEFTGRQDVQEAVRRAAKLMISKYGPGRPYWNEGAVLGGGGPGHDLMFVDVCEWLHRLTGDPEFAGFARFLYDGYSRLADCREHDIQLRNLADMSLRFEGHGAHVMEHLRVPLFVYHASGDDAYRAAAENVFPKTARHLSAGGACISDEGIGGRDGSPVIGCEYCTMYELLFSLQSGVQKTGRAALADWIEVLAFNAAEGARLRDGRAIQYCTRDNQYDATRQGAGSRFKLSPTHDDVAVCCPVTALKFFPYFTGSLWMKTKDGGGLAAVGYAPCELRTTIRGVGVRILSETGYPFEDRVRMTITPEKPLVFGLRLRLPCWAGGVRVEAAGATAEDVDHWRVLTKEWRPGDRVEIAFEPAIERKAMPNGEVYWKRGPLVYALPIAAQRRDVLSYAVPGFADYEYTPVTTAFWDYAEGDAGGDFRFCGGEATGDPWSRSPVRLTGTLVHRKTGRDEAVSLVPMGASLLRRVTFPEVKSLRLLERQAEMMKGPLNLARRARAEASSSSPGYQAQAVADGVAEGFPDRPSAEWASLHETTGAKVKLTWAEPVAANAVWLWDRPNPADHVRGAEIRFSDGSRVTVGELPNDGAAPVRVEFAEKTIAWLEVTITRAGPRTRNSGFSEIAVFGREQQPAVAAEGMPNIVVILADDLGYGDVACYNAESKLPTPRIDRLANEGMRFTDAHSASACTPTRYGILTGRYAFRSRVPVNVLKPYDPPLIEDGRLTLPAMLKQRGYRTACIGKWHLGWDWPFKDGDRNADPDFTRPVANGPVTRGFDEYFGTDVPNYPPYAFLRDDRLTVQPTARFPGQDQKLFVFQQGAMAPGWKFEEIMPTLAVRVSDFLRARAADRQPFFLYYTLTIPHEPLAPAQEFLDRSRINRVGDLVLQTDAAVGAVLDTLKDAGLDRNTLVFFASDNGHGPATGVPALLAAGHDPSRPFRGYKGSLLEGGHRVPFIARWPGKVKAGTVCDEVISLNSLMATSAEIAGAKIPPGAGQDSFSILPLLLGKPAEYRPARPVEIHAGVSGMAVRQGRWKLVESRARAVNPARPEALSGLYDLQADPAETNNVAAQHPDVVAALKEQLDKFAVGEAAPVQTRKPNILLMVADDLGYGDLSAYGCTDFKTPQLDALAAGGMRFEAGYVTAPLCSPSRAGLLTGRHQCRFLSYGGNPPNPETGLPTDLRTLADHLKGAGYRTAALGKWHLGESAELHPMSRGFDEFFGFLSGMHDYFKTDDPRWGSILRGRQREELKQYLTFALADEACAFVRRDSPSPFFLYLAFNAPHLPHQAPEEYLARTAHLADPKRRINAAMILALDDAVGRVMTALRESGRLENTLVIFLSDNGAALLKGAAENGGSNAPLRGGKTQLWEGGIRIPFSVSWKGRIAAGGVTPVPVSALDVMPTALAAAGVNVSPDWKLEGFNLLPWLAGDSAAPKRGPLFWKFGVGQTALRDGDMKRVRVGQEGGLFNVLGDPGETKDLAGGPSSPAGRLERVWREWDSENIRLQPAANKGPAH